jgi:hypothetical protein
MVTCWAATAFSRQISPFLIAGRSEWKVTNCTWNVTYPASNSWLNTTAADQVVKLSFVHQRPTARIAGLDMLP